MSIHSRFRRKLFRSRLNRATTYSQYYEDRSEYGHSFRKERQFSISTLSLHRSYQLKQPGTERTKREITAQSKAQVKALKTSVTKAKSRLVTKPGRWADGTAQHSDEED